MADAGDEAFLGGLGRLRSAPKTVSVAGKGFSEIIDKIAVCAEKTPAGDAIRKPLHADTPEEIHRRTVVAELWAYESLAKEGVEDAERQAQLAKSAFIAGKNHKTILKKKPLSALYDLPTLGERGEAAPITTQLLIHLAEFAWEYYRVDVTGMLLAAIDRNVIAQSTDNPKPEMLPRLTMSAVDSPTPVGHEEKAMTESSKDQTQLQIQSAESFGEDVHYGILAFRYDEFAAVMGKVYEEKFDVIFDSRFPVRKIVKTRAFDYQIAYMMTRNGDRVTIALTRVTQQGHAHAQMVTADMRRALKPRCIVAIGIAGGVPEKEFSLGDVIVCSPKFHDFSMTRASADGTDDAVPDTGEIHGAIQAVVGTLHSDALAGWNSEESIGAKCPSVDYENLRNYRSDDLEWNENLKQYLSLRFGPSSTRTRPFVIDGELASGIKLVKKPGVIKAWRKSAPGIKAVEMELPGVVKGATEVPGESTPPVLAIRGISDVIGFERDAAWTLYACQSAASFLKHFIQADLLQITNTAPAAAARTVKESLADALDTLPSREEWDEWVAIWLKAIRECFREPIFVKFKDHFNFRDGFPEELGKILKAGAHDAGWEGLAALRTLLRRFDDKRRDGYVSLSKSDCTALRRQIEKVMAWLIRLCVNPKRLRAIGVDRDGREFKPLTVIAAETAQGVSYVIRENYAKVMIENPADPKAVLADSHLVSPNGVESGGRWSSEDDLAYGLHQVLLPTNDSPSDKDTVKSEVRGEVESRLYDGRRVLIYVDGDQRPDDCRRMAQWAFDELNVPFIMREKIKNSALFMGSEQTIRFVVRDIYLIIREWGVELI